KCTEPVEVKDVFVKVCDKVSEGSANNELETSFSAAAAPAPAAQRSAPSTAAAPATAATPPATAPVSPAAGKIDESAIS
ncbi:dihydrolipoamide acetyltransferase, partial [Neisseria sp. P0001.S008]